MPQNKNIVICCDGTGCQFGDNNTNVVKIYQLAQKNKNQIAYYDPGVGTGGWGYDRVKRIMKKLYDGAFGSGLQKNVEDAYKFLMRNYADGDRIYLFGFSRGAFTVRSLAGMLHKCGLLHPDMLNMVEYTSKMYNTKNNDPIAAEFKATFSRKCPVYFIGVWDTVESLALNAGKKFHNVRLNPEAGFGYHAVALDEIRNNFQPYMWEERNDVEQVWFAGVHSDVGGWYGDTGLSDIALKWMAEKAKKHGMPLDEKMLADIKENPLAMQHNSRSGRWLLARKHIRKLPPNSKVHISVKERLGKPVKIGDGKSKAKETREYIPEAKIGGGGKWSADSIAVEWVE